MICPDPEAIELAAEWLEMYEDAPGIDGRSEAEACRHVATWLREYSRNSETRRIAREVGCTVAYARKYMMGLS